MDLQALNSGTPITKNFLNPVCGKLTAGTVFSGPSPGSPVVTSQYSQISSVISSNTTLASFTDGAADFVGSLTIPILPPGSIVKIKAYGKAGLASGTINYSLYIDGKQATSPTQYAGFVDNTVPTFVESYISIKTNNNATTFLAATMNGIFPFQADNQVAIAYDSTTTHQIDIFASFSVASVNNSFNCNGFFVELSSVS